MVDKKSAESKKQFEKRWKQKFIKPKKTPKGKEGLKVLTINDLEYHEDHLRKKLEKSKGYIFNSKMSLIKIEFDLKHPPKLSEKDKETLLKKKNLLEHNVEAHEKRIETFYKLLDEVARERKRRIVNPKAFKYKFW